MAQLKDTTITGSLSVSNTANITGATQHNDDVTLYSASGDSPALYFQRGTTSDTLNDYKIYDTGGYLKIKQSGNSGTSGYTQVAELTNAGKLTLSTPPATDTTPSTTAWISPTDSGIKIATDATIANGDKLVIRDADGSNLMKSSSITFGTSTTTFLRNNGTWQEAGGNYTATTPIEISSSNVISHSTSGVTANTYNMSQDSTTGNIYIPQFTVDAKGHITAASESTDYIPVLSSNTNYSGLLSKTDYDNLSTVVNGGIHLVTNSTSAEAYTSNPISYTLTSTDVTNKYMTITLSIDTTDYGTTHGWYVNGGTFRLLGIFFTKTFSILQPGTTTTYITCTKPIDFDWACTDFSYNSTTSKYEATLYLYHNINDSKFGSINIYPLVVRRWVM